MVKFAKDGDPSLLIWKVPPEFIDDGSEGVQILALPLLSRPGGILFAVPDKVLSTNLLLDAMLRDEASTLGPSREFAAQLIVEGESGAGVVDLPNSVNFLALDLEDSVLSDMREYDVLADMSEIIVPFFAEEPNALPKLTPVLPLIYEWIDVVAHERLNFYSAREEPDVPPALPPAKRAAAPKKSGKATLATLASQMALMQQQLQAVVAQQDSLVQGSLTSSGSANHALGLAPMAAVVPSLSAGCMPGSRPKTAAQLVGPPPKTKATAPADVTGAVPPVAPIQGGPAGGRDQMSEVLTQQSAALTQLVAHLTGGDPMADLSLSSASTPGFSHGTKGVARREKMQNDLASRNSTYFLQVQQQLFKRMNPARSVPKTPEELAQTDVSMLTYLERYGGFRHCRETGLIMWIVGHAMDAAAQEDFYATKEYLALLTASLEQSAMDGGWGIAYLLSLMEDPPQQLFTDRMANPSSAGRPFAPLVPPAWAAVALAYMKELEVLTSRKAEVKKQPAVAPKASAAQGEPPSDASPKRKPRFPKKPKAGADSP